MKNSKLSIFISLTLTMLLAFFLVTSPATSQEKKAAESALSDDTVRVPPGDPTAFWDEMGWNDMTKAEQALWGVLGWTEASWSEEEKPPASEDKYWNQLSDKEREAAEKLGYTKATWDKS